MKLVKNIRKNLKNPKKKSLTLLGLYLVFFIIVFIVFSTTDTKNENLPTTNIPESRENIEETYKNMSNYNYKITFINNNFQNIINGKYESNTSEFTYNNHNYYYENDKLYCIDNGLKTDTVIEYNVNKFFNINLYTLFDKLIEEYKTEYKDGRILTSYTLDSNVFYNYYYGIDGSYNSNIKIDILEIDNKITNIVIDTTNLGVNITKIEIEYEV